MNKFRIKKKLYLVVFLGVMALGAGSLLSPVRTAAEETGAGSGSQEPGTKSQGIPAVKKKGTVMVYYKDLAGYPGLGVTAKYRKKKGLLQIDRNNIHVTLYAGKKKMLVNDEMKHTLPVPVSVMKTEAGKKRLMIPARAVGQVLGLNYKYNSSKSLVTYTAKKANVSSSKNLQAKPFMLMSTEEFVRYMGPIARADYHKTGVLASVTLAQAIHESYAGCSLLAQKGNNLFGMKTYLSGNNWGGSAWKGKVFVKRTKEEYNHRTVTITARFRKYDNVMQSVNDHSAYLKNARNGSRRRYAGLTNTRSYKKQLQIIKKGGYCTFANYTTMLGRVIKRYDLTKYDK